MAGPLAMLATAAAWFTHTNHAATARLIDCERAWTIVGACASGVVVGSVLDARAVRGSLLRTLAALLVLAPGLGALVGLCAIVPTWRSTTDVESARFALGGALAGLAFIPFAAALAQVRRSESGARAGSVIWDVDRRTLWAMVGAFVSLGAAIAYVMNRRIELGSDAGSVNALTVGFGALASVAVAGAFGRNLLVKREVSMLVCEAIDMEPCDGAPRDERKVFEVDLGLGQREVGRREKITTSAYRANRPLVMVVRGSTEAAFAAVSRGVRRVAGLLMLAVLACATEIAVFALVGAKTF